MTTQRTMDDPPVGGWQRNLLLASAVMTYALITMGGIVCVTGSGRGCPDWPGCYGQVVPPLRGDAIIEYLHRFSAAMTSPVIIAAALVNWRKARSIRWVSRPVALAVAFLFAVIVFGAFAIVTGIPPWVAAIDLGSALIVLALLLTAYVVALSRRTAPGLPDRLAFSSPFARLSLVTAGAAFLVLASSVLAVDSGSISRCLGWPIYGEPIALGDWQGSVGTVRRVLAVITSIGVLALLVQAWRGRRERPGVLGAVASVGALFIVESALGAFIGMGAPAVLLRSIYVATTAAFWASLVVLTVRAGLTEPLATTSGFKMRSTDSLNSI